MSGLDIEGVLAGHSVAGMAGLEGEVLCGCDRRWRKPQEYRAHVAAALREQIAAWVAAAWEQGLRHRSILDLDTADMLAKANPYRAAQVAPSRVPGAGS